MTIKIHDNISGMPVIIHDKIETNTMSKIVKISLQNFKAITDFTANFNGCSAIVTGGNNKGKSSLLNGIIARIRGERPDLIVKEGETNGKGEMLLTDGCKFVWEFSIPEIGKKGKDKLTYYTKDNLKVDFTASLGKRYFPASFNIDDFMAKTPKEKSKALQLMAGIDFTSIDARYKAAFDARTDAKRVYENFKAILDSTPKPDEVAPVSLDELQAKKESIADKLNNQYLSNKANNEARRKEWNAIVDAEKEKENKNAIAIRIANENLDSCTKAVDVLIDNGFGAIMLNSFLLKLKSEIPSTYVAQIPSKPEYINEMPDNGPMIEIDRQIMNASETNEKSRKYKEYVELTSKKADAQQRALEIHNEVLAIEAERKEMLANAAFPEGIEITPGGEILTDKFPLDNNQISQSKKYITALKIASMGLGEVKMLHFDASSLDKNSLAEIQDWAATKGLQLLIERPDFDGGEIEYRLIEETVQQ